MRSARLGSVLLTSFRCAAVSEIIDTAGARFAGFHPLGFPLPDRLPMAVELSSPVL
jgi:hypothetical protein